MKSTDQIEKYNQVLINKYTPLCEHEGDSLKNKVPYALCTCECKKNIALITRLYKFNVPERFVGITKSKVVQSLHVFNEVVLVYCKHLNKALKNGLGVLFYGDNGTGKTMFMSYMIKVIAYKTNYSCYYITMPSLVNLIFKSNGFDDESRALRNKLDDLMVNTDFLFLDEFNKGSVAPSVRSYVERILRHRHDNRLPFIMGTNTSLSDLFQDGTDEGYGATVKSLLEGSCEIICMDPGDFRPKLYEKLSSDIYNSSQPLKLEVDDL